VNRRSVAVVCVSVLVLAAGALVGIHLFRSDVGGPVAAPRADSKDPLHPIHQASSARSREAPALLSVDQTGGLVSTPWRLVQVSGRDVYINYDIGSSSCDTDKGVYLKETPHRVLLGHYVHDTSSDSACTADMQAGNGVVHLAKPLGKRSLWHVVVADGW
jgi:hypothetical protein